MTTSFTDALKRNVVAEDTAEDIGQIGTFICDPAGRNITQLQVGGRKRKPQVVDYRAVASFGPDVVLVSSANDIRDDVDDRTQDAVKGNIDFIGSRVLSTDGQLHGSVTDVHFDETTGAITGLLGDEVGRVDASAIRSLGSYAVVIDSPTPS